MSKDLKFEEIAISDRVLFDEIVYGNRLYGDLIDSDINFNSMFIWSSCDKAQKCILEKGIILRYMSFEGEQMFYPPLVREEKDFAAYVDIICGYCMEKGITMKIGCISSSMAELMRQHRNEKYVIKNIPDNNEYIYNASEIISLRGKDYHAKRNHLNSFNATYEHEFLPYDPSMKNEILRLVEHWGAAKTSAYLCEYSAIEQALTFIDKLDIFCDVLKAEGKIAAFAVGFKNPANVGVVLYEKADHEYRGVYAAINNLVAAKHFSDCTFINRQEDMGIEGLRKAKQSYYPVTYAYKYQILLSSQE